MFPAPGQSSLPITINRLTCLLAMLVCMLAPGLPHTPALAASIVLDPGHGGNDRGAGSGDAYTEKHFTLALARRVAAELSANHRVELTRSADIELNPADRAGMANHQRVDLLVSVHGAVAPYCNQRTATVYYHDDEHLVLPPSHAGPAGTSTPDNDPVPWERLHRRHQPQSRAIAAAIRQSLAANDLFDTVAMRPAPLAVLMGADMPAVLLELGCFSAATPLTQAQFEQGLNDYARPVAAAIDAAVAGLEP